MSWDHYANLHHIYVLVLKKDFLIGIAISTTPIDTQIKKLAAHLDLAGETLFIMDKLSKLNNSKDTIGEKKKICRNTMLKLHQNMI